MADRSLVHVAFYAALIAALGLVPPVAIAFLGGVPITAQTLGVMLAGVMLGPIRGALAVLLFLFLVALGLPFLSGGRGGLGVFMGPSVGFLIGWPVGALVAGLIMQSTRELNILVSSAIAAAVGGILVVYAFGIPGVAIMAGLSLPKAALGSAIYIPGDLVKVALTALIVQTVARGLPGAVLSRS
ncbi:MULTISPECIES: biotin transporter BioY [Stappiaceae]|uniref:Biotin transporter n=2 Tax=Roseibium TaxID=150830 RepID=A0A0M6YAR8_9HYPH|nr:MULTISPECIES: BioY family transporter [Stappiaceae]MCR9285741.1 BioY family transporter [Paracoccaceae bacterium]MEC9471905.1 BioY family transporter [Pseudomonadota bacterium]AMN55480.1 biotin biosynthesis protein BioC [Labrenzia sp. CP4]AQQ07315.1 BioY family transporter [Roseibium aggregatum]MBN8183430.1 BioY family transporter [Roseibium aggregatum]